MQRDSKVVNSLKAILSPGVHAGALTSFDAATRARVGRAVLGCTCPLLRKIRVHSGNDCSNCHEPGLSVEKEGYDNSYSSGMIEILNERGFYNLKEMIDEL